MALTWDLDKPENNVTVASLPGHIRDVKTAVDSAIDDEHDAGSYGQDAEPSTRPDGEAFTAADLGRIWVDTDSTPDNAVYVLTSFSPVTWTPVSTEIIATLLASARTFAEAITLEKTLEVTGATTLTGTATMAVSPVFTKGIVANTSYLQGRNAADDGNADMITVDANDHACLADGAVVAAATEVGDGDRTIVDKAYADTKGIFGMPGTSLSRVNTTHGTFQDVDVGSQVAAIGANNAIVLLRLTNVGTADIFRLREDGTSDAIPTTTQNNSVSQAYIDTNKTVYLLVPLVAGVFEIASVTYDSSVDIEVIAYWRN